MQYSEFAYIYDALMHADIDYGKWCDYIENLFDLHGSEVNSICELACGTGNMTSILEGRGYKMTASDISSDMLMVAKEKLQRTKLICSDMSEIKLKQKYDSFLCMIDGINYVLLPERILNTFKTVKKSLNENGIFIFDISSRYKLKNILGNETFIHSDYDIFYSWQNRYMEKHSLSDMLLNFFVREGDGYSRFEERHLQRGWSEKQLCKLLEKAGFTEITTYSELTFSAPEKDSERIVFVCK